MCNLWGRGGGRGGETERTRGARWRRRVAWRAEPRSKVAFDIEDTGPGVVKLTVIHDSFEPGSDVLQAISDGWPAVLASLKTLLETGTALPGS